MKTYLFSFLAGFALIMALMANSQTLAKKLFLPLPELVSVQANDLNSSLLDYGMLVTGDVRNDGGDGYVKVKAVVYQGKHQWIKTTTIYLESGNTGNFEISFNEISFIGDQPKVKVLVQSL